jgi:hypothetical protein
MSDRELQQRIVDLQHALDAAHRRVRELEDDLSPLRARQRATAPRD